MKIDYDKVADAIYFTIKDGKVSKTLKVKDRLFVDVSSKGDVLGIELLDASSIQSKELEKNIRNGIPVNLISDIRTKV